MKRLGARSSEDILQRLMSSSVSGTVDRSDEAFAAIRSFQTHFNRLNRTPEMIRVMLQCEFNFTGQIDAMDSSVGPEERARILEADWFDSTFVVVDYSDVEAWVDKVHREVEKGCTVVALVPARTNTQWFHERVLEGADEVRFVKGRITFSGRSAPSAYPDAICIFRRFSSKAPRPKRGGVAILQCSTSLAGPGSSTTFSADVVPTGERAASSAASSAEEKMSVPLRKRERAATAATASSRSKPKAKPKPKPKPAGQR